MEKNAILAIVLSILVMLIWQVLFTPPQQQPREEQAGQEELAKQQTQSEGTPIEQVQDVAAPVEGMLPSTEISKREFHEDAEDIVVETPLLRVVITTQGARMTSCRILAHKDVNGNTVELVSNDARRRGQFPLEVAFGDASFAEELNTELYQSFVTAMTLRPEDDARTLSLSYTAQNGTTFTKVFTFHPDSYLIDIALKFSDPDRIGKSVSVVWGPGLGEDLEDALRFDPGVVSKTSDGKPVRDSAKKIDGLRTYNDVQWAALNRKYFTAAFFAGARNNKLSLTNIPLQPQEGEKSVEPMRQVLIGLSQPLSDGETQLSLYAGPKQRAELENASNNFDQLIDYGFFSLIAEPLAKFMTFLHGHLNNYGLVIICLTILIKIVFFPLTHKSFTSMRKMQELQPQMNVIKEKHKKDQQKQQQEMMKLYKEKGVNPMGGCLPMVLQIPVFIALYQTLSQSIELRGASFLWIPDLSAHEVVSFLEGTFLGPYTRPLVLMMGASMFFQQSMTPTAADNKQAQMFKFMPLIFLAMFWNFPAGLVLYWFMNNFLTIGQQYLINKSGAKSSKKKEKTNEETPSASTSQKRRKKSK